MIYKSSTMSRMHFNVSRLFFSRQCQPQRTLTRLLPLKTAFEQQYQYCPFATSAASSGTIFSMPETKRFITECMFKIGTPRSHAAELAEVLISADYRGHFSHGLNRLELYVQDVSSGTCDSKAIPSILKQTAATAYVDGNGGLGPVIGNFCMKLAIEKCKGSGVGWVVAKGSNHYGIAGWYSLQAIEHNLLGMSFTNTSPFMAPTRSKEAALGTNPITVGAKGINNDQFVLDMATTAVAVGKIELQQRKGEPIPRGWAQTKSGDITTDASEAMKAACLMPLGGAEINSGYKGYGLAVMVEIFCGILAGSAYGPNVRRWIDSSKPANLGQCFVAIDPNCFAPGFNERLSDLLQYLRNMEPIDPSKPVLVAGDPESAHMKKVDTMGGIEYHVNQVKAAKTIAQKLGVDPMEPLA